MMNAKFKTHNLKFALAVGALLFSLCGSADAQIQAKVHRIGYLSASSAEVDKDRFAYFQGGLKGLGYIDGKNIAIEQRSGSGQFDTIPKQLGELIGHKVDVRVVYGESAILAAKNATTAIPIVMTVHPDPVGDGIVASL